MVLLITGAITPAENIKMTALNNKEKRQRQYLDALLGMVELVSDMASVNENRLVKSQSKSQSGPVSICYCDNSLPDRTIFNDVCEVANRKNVNMEILLFKGDHVKTAEYGKGYGEGEIIKYAMENSLLMKNDSYFFKLTGKLLIDNIVKIIKRSNINKIYFNIPNHTRRDICDTRFYGMPLEVYNKYFLNAYEKVRDEEGYFLEHSFLDEIRKNHLVTYNFPLYPLYNGISGSSAAIYKYKVWKTEIKNCLSIFQFYKVK